MKKVVSKDDECFSQQDKISFSLYFKHIIVPSFVILCIEEEELARLKYNNAEVCI